MKKPVASFIKVFVLCLPAATLLALGVALYERAHNASFGAARLASDGTFVSGIILFCLGALGVASGAGAFLALSYGFSKLAGRLCRPKNIAVSEKETYFDYCSRKKAVRKTSGTLFSFAALLAAGILFIAVSVIAAFVY